MVDLYRYINLNREIEVMRDHIKELEAKAESLGAMNISDMPKAQSHGNSMEDTIIKIADMKVLYHQKISDSLDAIYEIEEAIQTLPDVERIIMRRKYIKGETLEQIAVAMNYSYRNIRRRHKRAIKMLSSHVPYNQ